MQGRRGANVDYQHKTVINRESLFQEGHLSSKEELKKRMGDNSGTILGEGKDS